MKFCKHDKEYITKVICASTARREAEIFHKSLIEVSKKYTKMITDHLKKPCTCTFEVPKKSKTKLK